MHNVFVGAQYVQRKRQAMSKSVWVYNLPSKIQTSAHKHGFENYEKDTLDSYKIQVATCKQ